jgi:hypothetical protein
MPPAPRSFLVHCSCSTAVAVRAGQAGERISGPSCGAQIAVPRLRDLEQLPVAEPSASAPRRWDAARGYVLAGIALATLAALAAASTPLLGGWFLAPIVPDAVIRAAINGAADADVYVAWRAVRRVGVNRAVTHDEARRILFTQLAGSLTAVFWGVAAIGAGLAAVGGVMLARNAARPESRP